MVSFRTSIPTVAVDDLLTTRLRAKNTWLTIVKASAAAGLAWTIALQFSSSDVPVLAPSGGRHVFTDDASDTIRALDSQAVDDVIAADQSLLGRIDQMRDELMRVGPWTRHLSERGEVGRCSAWPAGSGAQATMSP